MSPFEQLVDLPGWIVAVALLPWWLRRLLALVRDTENYLVERSARRKK